MAGWSPFAPRNWRDFFATYAERKATKDFPQQKPNSLCGSGVVCRTKCNTVTQKRVSTLLWILVRIVLPWAVAMDMLIRRWGKENVVYAIFVPLFVVFHLYFSSGDRPDVPASLQPRGFRPLVAFWHFLDGLALLGLLFFEFATAMAAELRGWNGGWWLTFLIVTTIYVFPYATLTVVARCLLWKANRLVDEVVAELKLTRQSHAQQSQ